MQSDFERIVHAIFEYRSFGEYTDFDKLGVHEIFRQYYYFTCDVISRLAKIDSENTANYYEDNKD